MRIGHGFDTHRFTPAPDASQPLVLGGITFPHERGLAAHSDGDVLLHALMDALLGAMAQPDIGMMFPPGDDAYLHADSAALLATVTEKMRLNGFRLVNCDMVIMAQRPRLAPHIPAMRTRIAEIMGVDKLQIGIKGTTTEKLGFIGREEGIAASAVVLLEETL